MAVFEFPASAAQRRMWLLDQLDPGQVTYHIGFAVWLDGPLDPVALGGAWAAVVARHEVLRTTFRANGGLPIQVIDDDIRPDDLVAVPLTHLPAAERETAARAAIREHARIPLPLDRGPLVRARLLRLAPDRHVLSLVAHHAVADGWSFRLLFDELAADYAALRAGRPVDPAEPELQYADYALWEREHTDAGGYAEAERFWPTELAGAPPEVALPVDHPYPARLGPDAAEVAVPVDATLAGALRQLAASRGSTLFAVLLAAYAALLSRLSGTDELLIGVPVAGRTRPETERMLGLFANTVAIRAELTDDPTLGQLVDRLHTTTARAQAHQDLPFARVVELCRPERHPSRSPLLQVMCTVDDALPVLDRGDLRWRPELVHNGTGKFELELAAVAGPDELTVRLRYLTDLFTPAGAERFADALGAVLTALATGPQLRVSEVDILSPATRDLVTRVWPASGTPSGPPPGSTATALVSGIDAGDRVVIEGPDGALTGTRLRALTDRIAAGLLDAGVRVQDTVGIVLPRGARVLPALLGVWRLGAAYLPLDPTHPPQRLRGMLADAGVRVVVTDRTAIPAPLRAELDASSTVLDLAGTDDLAGVHGTADPGPVAVPPVREVPPSAAAYVLFTSGSTGRPKAVTVTQGAVAHLLHAFRELVPLGPDDRVVSVSPFAFDIALLDLLLPLWRGAPVVVAGEDDVIDGNRLRRLLTTTAATMLQATPTTWRMLVAAGGVPDGVRLRLSGGEALPRSLADALLAPGVQLWNLYGPTETTVYSTGAEVAPGPGPLDIGPAIAGTRVYLLDRWLRPVPPGVVGEICLGGAGLGRGYAGAPGLTGERFLPDPFTPGGRLYRSGDLGRWLPNGRIEPLGRADRQVKVRGFRVETGEVEAVLRDHPEVRDAVVVTSTGPDHDGARLVGYVVPVSGAAGPPAGLREYVSRVLPGHMVPSAFVALAEVPRTSRGKLDERALPQPRWGADGDGATVAPRTPLERELVALVADLLGLPGPVGVRNNFFALGGHSVKATQLMARIWSTYGVDLPVRTLFDDPTMAGLAAALAAAGVATGTGATAAASVAGTGAGAARGTGTAGTDDFDMLTDDDVDDLLAGMDRSAGRVGTGEV
ncbi:non-ribosomal peptide synthetase [Micromonospora echinofusca]|uniref:Amino acid adenylation domain-containing protein n=1 Tax=Micromonospora echinofusca TaxID=47858 RepID=A0ABS3VR60_MICEH|nr:non-ribosomal peptide synthetase [Micromonospora echinofusca]MBO4206951.1 amino acid adenylation domain-containing protein [Micromonospora echinofusca]